MNKKPRKRKPNFEIWSEQPMSTPLGYRDLIDFVTRFRPEDVDSFYCLVNKKPA